jgi:glycosyltransferase involved in cell wall biosynthesis
VDIPGVQSLAAQSPVVPEGSFTLSLTPEPPRAETSVVAPPPDAREAGAAALRAEYGIEPDAHVLLCLSRISPEKGHDFVLRTLLEWERSPSFPSPPVWLFICGEPAFMNGRRYARRLKALAARLNRVRVVFPGYVTGARKRAFFALASVYLFPSSHESYGLTLMEALGAGLPAISRDHAGARQILSPEFGVIVPGSGRSARLGFRHALERLLSDEPLRASMAQAASQWANARPFCGSADTLAGLLTQPPSE